MYTVGPVSECNKLEEGGPRGDLGVVVFFLCNISYQEFVSLYRLKIRAKRKEEKGGGFILNFLCLNHCRRWEFGRGRVSQIGEVQRMALCFIAFSGNTEHYRKKKYHTILKE